MRFRKNRPILGRSDTNKSSKNWHIYEKLLFTLGLFTGVLLSFTGYKINLFITTHTFHVQSPVELQTPLQVKKAQAQEFRSPEATNSPHLKNDTKKDEVQEVMSPETIFNKYKYGSVIYKIWQIESNQGQAPEGYHIQCKNLGMTNEFGFGVYENICFKDFDEAVATVNEWFKNRISEGLTLAQALCYYNEGIQKDDCWYYQSYKTI